MQDRWSRPVILEVHGIGRYRTIVGTREAIACLLDEWLFEDGDALEGAFTVCMLADEGKMSHEMARDAFIGAAQDAAIYVVPESMANLGEELRLPKSDSPTRLRLEKN
jgi:hypothetical protein